MGPVGDVALQQGKRPFARVRSGVVPAAAHDLLGLGAVKLGGHLLDHVFLLDVTVGIDESGALEEALHEAPRVGVGIRGVPVAEPLDGVLRGAGLLHALAGQLAGRFLLLLGDGLGNEVFLHHA